MEFNSLSNPLGTHMKNENTKIAILHPNLQIRELIKNQIMTVLPKLICITAATEAALVKKLYWFTPHIILSNIPIANSTNEEASTYILSLLRGIPVINITEKNSSTFESADSMASYGYYCISIAEQEQIAGQVLSFLEKKMTLIHLNTQKEQTKVRSSLALQRAMLLLEGANTSDIKLEVLNCLKETENFFNMILFPENHITRH